MPRVNSKNCGALEPVVVENALNAKEKSAIKTEVENPVEQQVWHRKSERRRVARDIFLVFEEQRSTRRSRGTSSKRQSRPKSKFGHLKVEQPNKAKTLLRDIKNEPKCYLSNQQAANQQAQQKEQHVKTKPLPKSENTTVFKSNVSNAAAPPAPISTTKSTSVCTAASAGESSNLSARVNPIFLWVKQDNTRIVEVRCEDYDKRNRIRITKTTNGWRAIPRTDPTSSRIVKFFQAPLLKVKRELYQMNQALEVCESTNTDVDIEVQQESMAAFALVNKRENDVIKRNSKNSKETRSQKKKKVIKEVKLKDDDVSIARLANDASNSSHSTYSSEENALEKLHILEENDVANEERLHSTSSDSNIDSFEELDATKDGFVDNPYGENATQDVEADTYQNSTATTPELQLCPKTGLFLPSHVTGSNPHVAVDVNTLPLAKDILVDLVDCEIEFQNRQELVLEPIDVETKNLKELLDEADLLQHCGDNANSGAELIDSLVKRSCEDNLIQDTDILKDAVHINETFSAVDECDLTQKEMISEAIPQMPEPVSDPPKCLSFNEAGEIEGLNGELFQSHSFNETFDKEPAMELVTELDTDPHKKTTTEATEIITLNSSPELSDSITDIVTEETPKDLSYKKREEVCPPPESRSQCAVTSSSDVIKSPVQDGIPGIESTSETIKNLILEQFMKLSTLNSAPSSTAKTQQPEPIDLGANSLLTTANSVDSGYSAVSNFIETVVIDDNSDEQPVKKRVRNAVNLEEPQPAVTLDKDPDPLTQLQLLIKNTQWKVPDPILVPKDRLGAVLASPAREIPLLITTRPELRLPEAFAHPEIIQNPNILVISMAQLEAILKNEVEVEKNKALKASVAVSASDSEFCIDIPRKVNQQYETEFRADPKLRLPESVDVNRKCDHVETSLASDISAATLAMLNQMLWLPYFGQLSQEFFKSLKDPANSQNKYPASILPFYNPQIGLHHLDGLYKNYLKQLSQLKNMSMASPNERNNVYPNAFSALQNPVELAIFQKIIEHQMSNFLSMARFPLEAGQTFNQEPTSMKNSSNEHSSNVAKPLTTNTFDLKKNKKSQVKSNSLPFEVSDHNNVVEPPEKSQCFQKIKDNSGCGNSMTSNTELSKFNKLTMQQKPLPENKPRLTCKSLSNLMAADNIVATDALPIPLANLSTEGIKSKHESDNKHVNINKKSITTDNRCFQESCDMSTPRKRNFNFVESGANQTVAKNSDPLNNMEANPSLWHPLFGSNSKTSYSSPWQWTTVTAAGE